MTSEQGTWDEIPTETAKAGPRAVAPFSIKVLEIIYTICNNQQYQKSSPLVCL